MGTVYIPAWTLLQPSVGSLGTTGATLFFNIPHDYVSANTSQTQVFVHIVTDYQESVVSGTVATSLTWTFVDPTFTVPGVVNSLMSADISVTSAPSPFEYNHYLIPFETALSSATIHPDDFAALGVLRLSTGGGDYAANVYLTSIEFRYVLN